MDNIVKKVEKIKGNIFNYYFFDSTLETIKDLNSGDNIYYNEYYDSMLIIEKKDELIFIEKKDDVIKIKNNLLENNLKLHTKKHPNIFKALIKNNFHNDYDQDKLFSFFDNIINNKFLFNVDNEFKYFNNLLNNDIFFNEDNIIKFKKFINDNYNVLDKFKRDYLIEFEKKNKDFFKNFLKKIKDKNTIISYINDFDLETIEDIITIKKNLYQYYLIEKKIKNKKELFSDSSLLILKKLTENGISFNQINKEFLSKLKKYKDDKDLNKSLIIYKNNLNGWSIENYINKLNDLNIVYKKNNNKILCEISNYNQSCEIGSRNWCISTSEFYFDSYNNNLKRNYFFMDFDLEKFNNKSLVGLTINPNGDLYVAHDNYDNELTNIDFVLKEFNFNEITKEEILKRVKSPIEIVNSNLINSFKDVFLECLDDFKNDKKVIKDLLNNKKITNEIKNIIIDKYLNNMKPFDFIDITFGLYDEEIFNDQIKKIVNTKNNDMKEYFIKRVLFFDFDFNVNYINKKYDTLKNNLFDFILLDNFDTLKKILRENKEENLIQFNFINTLQDKKYENFEIEDIYNNYSICNLITSDIVCKIKNKDIKEKIIKKELLNCNHNIISSYTEGSENIFYKYIIEKNDIEKFKTNFLNIIKSPFLYKSTKNIENLIDFAKDKKIIDINNIEFNSIIYSNDNILKMFAKKNLISKENYMDYLAYCEMNNVNISNLGKKCNSYLSEIIKESNFFNINKLKKISFKY